MMERTKQKSLLNTAAKIISGIFHPLLTPVYGILIIISAPTLFGYMPFNVKKILLFIVLINNVLIPLSLLPYLRYRNLISSWSVEDRNERMLPLIGMSLFYSVTVYIFWRFQLPVFIKSYVLAIAIVAIAVTLINLRWRISIHATGTGALLALVAVLSVTMHSPLVILLAASILSAGLTMTSRLWLRLHSPSEVWAGFFLGLSSASLTLFLV